MSWDITKRSNQGEIISRSRTDVWTGKPYMYCNGCFADHETGLGGHVAETPSDLCVGAKVDGWRLTTTGQYCPNCKHKVLTYLAIVFGGYAEWWARKWPWASTKTVGTIIALELTFLLSAVVLSLLVFWWFKI